MPKFRAVAFTILLSLVLGAYQIFVPSATGPAFIASDAQAQGAAIAVVAHHQPARGGGKGSDPQRGAHRIDGEAALRCNIAERAVV